MSCGSRVVARVKVWMAKVISPFLAAAAWIVFAFGRRNRMEIRNPLNERRTESSECTRSASGPPPPPPRKHMSAVCCPPFHWRERQKQTGERRGGTTCLLPVTALAPSLGQIRNRERGCFGVTFGRPNSSYCCGGAEGVSVQRRRRSAGDRLGAKLKEILI